MSAAQQNKSVAKLINELFDSCLIGINELKRIIKQLFNLVKRIHLACSTNFSWIINEMKPKRRQIYFTPIQE